MSENHSTSGCPDALLPLWHPDVNPMDVRLLSNGPTPGALDPFTVGREGTRSREVLARESAVTVCDDLVHDTRHGHLYRHLLDQAVTATIRAEQDGHTAGSMHAMHAVIARWARGDHIGLDTDDAPAATWTALADAVDKRLSDVKRGPVGSLLFRRR